MVSKGYKIIYIYLSRSGGKNKENMRIELPREAERMGSVLMYGTQKVYELESGMASDTPANNGMFVVERASYEKLNEVQKNMAIVIPIKNERLKLLEGVLFGIPNSCLPIIISGSQREPTDRYQMEKDKIDTFCRFAKKEYVLAHQLDPIFSEAFNKSAYPHILDHEGVVKKGKAEGMLIGMLLARRLGKKYIGFIDADNYIPGSVFEYVKIYATSLAQFDTPYAMTRIHWNSKPKVMKNSLFFSKWGRVSRISNDYLNRLIAHYTGFETEVISTGNAGEHAMTMDLAMELDYSSRFSVETYHYINMWEQFGGVIPSKHPEIMRKGVNIFQVESRNPHLHEGKGEDHVNEMILHSLGVMYHSPITPDELKEEILEELYKGGILKTDELPPVLSQYPALRNIDLDTFFSEIDLGELSRLRKG